MGGSQALSRSLFAQLIPKGKEAEYFSIYEISDKGTSWLGPAFYGLALQWTGSYRIAILSLIVFFAAGLAILSRVNVQKGEQDVNASPARNPARQRRPGSTECMMSPSRFRVPAYRALLLLAPVRMKVTPLREYHNLR